MRNIPTSLIQANNKHSVVSGKEINPWPCSRQLELLPEGLASVDDYVEGDDVQ
jgi:hypothetical protein